MKNFYCTITTLIFAIILLIPPVSSAADDFSFDEAFGEDTAASGGSELEVHGEVSSKIRGILSTDDNEMNTLSTADIDLEYRGETVDGVIKLDIDKEDLIDEAFLRYYGKGYDFELGLMKVVWGKGDKVHVIDVLNSNDYTDFYNPDYIERRNAVPMSKINIFVGGQGKLELAYIPTLTPDTVPTGGLWAPQAALSASSLANSYVQFLAAEAYSTAYNAAGGSEPAKHTAGSISATAVLAEYADGEALYPNTDTLDYGQGAARFTNSLGGVDFGGLYYFGYNKKPSIRAKYNNPSDPSQITGLEIDYDRQHVFGLEAGAAPAGFNLRAEAAYYMTEDFDGDDPDVHNHSIRYLAGFDRDIPLHNINVNIQTVGSYRLENDEIKSYTDVEYAEKDDATQNLIALKISDSFNHEKVTPEFIGRYIIEEECWMVTPSISYAPTDDLEFVLSSTFFGGDDSTTFGQFDDNNFVELEGKVFF